jgi:hypothetical protein
MIEIHHPNGGSAVQQVQSPQVSLGNVSVFEEFLRFLLLLLLSAATALMEELLLPASAL